MAKPRKPRKPIYPHIFALSKQTMRMRRPWTAEDAMESIASHFTRPERIHITALTYGAR
jgi:hypothetical protein